MAQVDLETNGRRYHLSPGFAARRRRSLFIRAGIFAGLWLVVMVGMGVYGYVLTGNVSGSLMMSSMLCIGFFFGLAVMGGFLWLNLTVLRKSLDGYEVWLSDNTVSVRTMDIDPIVMRRDEITAISENKSHGLVVRAGDRPVMLIVNKDVEGYDEIKAVLTGWRPLSDKPQRIIPPQAIGIAFGVVLLGVALAPNWIVAAVVWLIGAVGIGYQIVTLIRIPEIKATARVLGIGFWVFLFVALTMHALNSMIRTSPEVLAAIRDALGVSPR
jgi:hypothetical protein